MSPKVDLENVKELTFYMGDKTDEELWAIVREACRGNTESWRAYEKIHWRYTHLGRLYDAARSTIRDVYSRIKVYI